jgi:hypothetical protein
VISVCKGIDISDIKIIVQWKAADTDLNTIIQRFGCGGRDLVSPTFCLLLVEPDFTDEVRESRRIEKAKKDARIAELLHLVGAAGAAGDKRRRDGEPAAATRRVRARVEPSKNPGDDARGSGGQGMSMDVDTTCDHNEEVDMFAEVDTPVEGAHHQLYHLKANQSVDTSGEARTYSGFRCQHLYQSSNTCARHLQALSSSSN